MKKIITSLMLTPLLVASPIIMAKDNHNNKHLYFHVIKESMIINKQEVRSVKLIKSSDNGNYGVEINLTQQAGKRFSQLTGSNIHRKMMMTIDNHIINIATLQSSLGARFQTFVTSKSVAEDIINALS